MPAWSTPWSAPACRRVQYEAAMGRLTLRFKSAGLETGFVMSRKQRLSEWISIMVIGLFILCVFSLSPDRFEAPSDVRMWQSAVFYGGTAVVAVMLIVAKALERSCLSPRNVVFCMEITTAVASVVMMVVGVSVSRHYIARIVGYGNTEAVWGRDLGYTDGVNLLVVNLCASVGHLAPVRWVFLFPVEVALVFVFGLPIFVWSSPSPDDVPILSLVAVCLAVLAAVGKRHSELNDRLLFKSLLSEKKLRFEAEHVLAVQQESAGAANGTDTLAATSAMGSFPETTSTAFPVEVDQTGGSAKLREIGIREQWLIEDTEVKALPDRVLGRGGFGLVTLGVYHNTPVALKTPQQDFATNVVSLHALCNELRILRRLRHPNIVFFYGAILGDSFVRLCLVLERIDGVNLGRFIQAHKLAGSSGGAGDPQRRPRSSTAIFNERKRIVCDTLNALRYLHSRTPAVVHGDLKDSNIFVQQLCLHGDTVARAKLLDFGLARLLTRSAEPMGGTAQWSAPELFGKRGNRPDRAADVYSVGLLMFFISTGAKPFGGAAATESGFPRSWPPTIAGRRPRYRGLPPSWPDDLQSLQCWHWCMASVEQCTQTRPEQRPTVEAVSDELDRGLDISSQGGASDAKSDGDPSFRRPEQAGSLDLAFPRRQPSELAVVFDGATFDVLGTSPAFDSRFGACPPGSAVSGWLSPESLEAFCERVHSFCTSGMSLCTFDWEPRGLRLPRAPDAPMPRRVSVTLWADRRGEEERVLARLVLPASRDRALHPPDGDADPSRPRCPSREPHPGAAPGPPPASVPEAVRGRGTAPPARPPLEPTARRARCPLSL
ncbi:unnamed protein product [Prorocentrum cordatum]|uniref:Protein kinase domain-containing protein n=1 Tax=Prorocentrum cordatum TaxID=2364126 RepID=A0ABN9RSE7_9DINO|nr:unnamed protein product [Polarella glacialis]